MKKKYILIILLTVSLFTLFFFFLLKKEKSIFVLEPKLIIEEIDTIKKDSQKQFKELNMIKKEEEKQKEEILTWVCGNPFTDIRDGQVYATVLIGSQCWMAQNLNIGTMNYKIGAQIDPDVIVKYCYGGLVANCTAEGGLYYWEQAQSICPVGWRLPSHRDFTTLERTVCTSTTCATDFPYDDDALGWRGTNEGMSLMIGGTSGWDGRLSGWLDSGRLDKTLAFYLHGKEALFWTSSFSELRQLGGPIARKLVGDRGDIGSFIARPRNYAMSVRCMR